MNTVTYLNERTLASAISIFLRLVTVSSSLMVALARSRIGKLLISRFELNACNKTSATCMEHGGRRGIASIFRPNLFTGYNNVT